MLPGTLDILILKFLERDGEPMQGYAIAPYLKQTSNDVLQVEKGSRYAVRQLLAIKGSGRAEWGQSENNRRARFYRLTASGRSRLRREAADFDRVIRAVLTLMRSAGGEAS